MTTASEILALIEAVDPSDTEKLYEIDCRVDCLIRFPQDEFCGMGSWFYRHKGNNQFEITERISSVRAYTLSRDDLKTIRPQGYNFGFYFVYRGNDKYNFCTGGNQTKNPHVNPICSPELPTEELSELHAIIQAIENERTKK